MSYPVGKIINLFISNRENKKRLEKPYLILEKEGIFEDKYYNTDIQRSILITSLSSYALLESENITIPYGSLGENFLIDYNLYHLSTGTQLKIGSSILEITQQCTICNHLSSIDKRVPALLKEDRGIFAKVIQKGKIHQEDKIFIVTCNPK